MGQSNSQNASNQEPSISELVKKHINDLDDKGKLQLPDDMPDWQKHTIRAEKRQRDAQSALLKTQAKLREIEAENTVLSETAQTIVPDDFQLSDDEIKQLEAIKFKDPDAYRLQVNKLEKAAKEAQAKKLSELTSKAREEASSQHINKTRVQVLAEFKDANPDLVITDDVLVNDVPPRLLKGVNDGNYTYAEYLEKVKDYLAKGVAIKEPAKGEKNNLSDLAGSKTPGKDAAERQGSKDYSKMTF